MSLVVDACVAIKWITEEKYSTAARLIYQHRKSIVLIAPDLFLPECVNALHKKVKLGEIDLDDVEKSLPVFLGGISTFIPISEVFQKAVEFSHNMNHSIYDCIYLATAYHVGGTLVTADEPFYKCLRSNQHEPLCRWIEDIEVISI